MGTACSILYILGNYSEKWRHIPRLDLPSLVNLASIDNGDGFFYSVMGAQFRFNSYQSDGGFHHGFPLLEDYCAVCAYFQYEAAVLTWWRLLSFIVGFQGIRRFQGSDLEAVFLFDFVFTVMDLVWHLSIFSVLHSVDYLSTVFFFFLALFDIWLSRIFTLLDWEIL